MATRKHSRKVFIGIAVLAVAGAFAWAFWPRPLLVDIGIGEHNRLDRRVPDALLRVQCGIVGALLADIGADIEQVPLLPVAADGEGGLVAPHHLGSAPPGGLAVVAVAVPLGQSAPGR